MPAAALTAIILLAGCGSANRTYITGSWDNPEHPSIETSKIIVIGISSNQTYRAIVEQTVADELTAAGFEAITGIQSFTREELHEMRDDVELANQRLGEIGVDAVLLMSVLDIDEDSYYVPGTVSYQPTVAYPWYGGYYGYWGTTYSTVYSPGYYEESLQVFLESNIYEVPSDVLIWSGQSKTEDPSSVQALADNFSRVLVDELVDGNVIRKAE
jgi:hypothetical protein